MNENYGTYRLIMSSEQTKHLLACIVAWSYDPCTNLSDPENIEIVRSIMPIKDQLKAQALAHIKDEEARFWEHF
jgi:hypothetical protein